jgi:hypothetical protein
MSASERALPYSPTLLVRKTQKRDTFLPFRNLRLFISKDIEGSGADKNDGPKYKRLEHDREY